MSTFGSAMMPPVGRRVGVKSVACPVCRFLVRRRPARETRQLGAGSGFGGPDNRSGYQGGPAARSATGGEPGVTTDRRSVYVRSAWLSVTGRETVGRGASR